MLLRWQCPSSEKYLVMLLISLNNSSIGLSDKNLAMLDDGNFLYTYLPGGAGNKWATMDQEEIYNGYYEGHCGSHGRTES